MPRRATRARASTAIAAAMPRGACSIATGTARGRRGPASRAMTAWATSCVDARLGQRAPRLLIRRINVTAVVIANALYILDPLELATAAG